MRQAPDCILIGEIRDKETMQAAIAYAQTGHLCLATLHANNSYHALNRIISFFPLENRPALFLDLSVSLRAIVSQRLVKKPDGKRTPTCEVMLNTRHISELIERGEVQAIKDAMEQSWRPARRPSSRICSGSTAKTSSRWTKRWPMPTRRPTCPG
jgi:twitching motility protein PilU